MTTYYSEYTEIPIGTFFSEPTELNLTVFSSPPSEVFLNYFSSPASEIVMSFDIPGGILTWTKVSALSSNTNAIRLHKTVEAGIPMGNTSSIISQAVSYVFEKIYGSDIFTPVHFSPSISIKNREFKIINVSNKINMFLEGEGKVDQREIGIRSHVRPLKVSIGRKDDKIALYIYFSDGNMYALDIEDGFTFSSSSISSNSSVSISTQSSSSSSSTLMYLTSTSLSPSSSSRSSGSSSSPSSLSSSSISSTSSSSGSSMSTSSQSSASSPSTGSSSSV